MALGVLALADSLLTPRQIQKMRLKAGLAILSACQTGLGVAHEAGTIGVARALNLAGVPGVVMSLWSADDDATMWLMQRFVELLEEHAPQEALTRAMREQRRRDPNPAKWASFSYFGVPMISGKLSQQTTEGR